MIIQNNIPSLKASNKQNAQGKKLNKAQEKLASGLRINRAGDDAAGLAISEKMRSQIRGLEKARNNIEDGINFLDVGDGGMGVIHDINKRLQELAVQAATDTTTSSDREAIQKEADALLLEIDDIAYNTHYNNIRMLCGGSTQTTVRPPSVSGGNTGGVGTVVGDEISDALANRITYGGSANDSMGSMVFDEGGTAVFVGNTQSGDQDLAGVPGGGVSGVNGWVCKVGSDGEPLWSVKVGADVNLNSIVKVKDGGYFVGGAVNGKTYFAKIDKNGTMEWDYTTGTGDTTVKGMVVNADGDVLVTTQMGIGGWTDEAGNPIGGPPKGGRDTIILKIDPMVNPNNDYFGTFKKYTASDGNDYVGLNVGGYDNEMLFKVAPTDDGGFIASGYTLSHFPGGVQVGSGNHDMWIAKFDKDGKPVKYLNYGDDGGSSAGGWGSQIIQTSDGGFILVGNSNMTGATGMTPPTMIPKDNIYIIKMTSDLVPEWSKSFGSSGDDSGSCVVETEDGYIFAGTVAGSNGDVTSAGLGGSDAWVFKIDKNGDMLWDKSFGGSGSDGFNYMYKTESGDIFLAGNTTSNDHDIDGKNKGNYDAWFLKISAQDGSIVRNPGNPPVPPANQVPEAPSMQVKHNGEIILQTGPKTGDTFTIKVADMRTETLFGKPVVLLFDPIEEAQRTIQKIQDAVQKVSADRSRFGAYRNALEFLLNNQTNYQENLTKSESRIRDADMAKEMMAYMQVSTLSRSAESMIAQANQAPTRVLELLK